MTLLETGKIVTTHGVRGEVRAEAWSNALEDLLDYPVFYRADGSSLVVERSRVHRGAVNLKFKGYDDIDSAMTLIGTVLHIDKDAVSLPEGTYFIQDLLGMRVLDSDTGECYGVIVQVQPTGANDVYHISQPGKRDKLIPAIRQVVVETDVDGGIMKIRPLKGLFDDAD